MTGFYMSRMWFMTFAGKPKHEAAKHVREATPWIKEPLVILTIISALGGFLLSVMGVVDYLSAEKDHLALHGVLETLEHAFLPSDTNLRLVGWTTILLSLVIGPIYAARVHGGRLAEGEKSNPMVAWLVSLSDRFGTQDVSEIAESSLSEALQNRLYFDDLYELVLAKTVIPFAAFAAWFDKNVVDGLVKQVESNSVLGSIQIRKVTTGRARDYILMTAVGALSIFALAWGVSG
jgi:NADH-quinone oxidoreductase subunit L